MEFIKNCKGEAFMLAMAMAVAISFIFGITAKMQLNECKASIKQEQTIGR